jgi:hypothetical protein
VELFRRGDALGRELRRNRPAPSDELVARIEARVRESAPVARRGSFRIAVPVALTAAMVAALAAVGGVGYAASSVKHAASAVVHVFAPAKQHRPVVLSGLTAGGDQYRPGYGFGDPNHNHTGPPGLTRKGGSFAPPLATKVKGTTAYVSTRFTIDEQAHLFISVVDTKGKKLLITQKKSAVGRGVKGKPTKTVQYLVLVPRSIPLKLALPANLVLPGHPYTIRVVARDPSGENSTLLIPFKG